MKSIWSIPLIFSIAFIFASNEEKIFSTKNPEISDSTHVVSIKATFIKKISTGCCCYVTIPETNLFRIITVSNGNAIEKTIKVDYGCNGKTNFIQGSIYNIKASKAPQNNFFQNIETTPELY